MCSMTDTNSRWYLLLAFKSEPSEVVVWLCIFCVAVYQGKKDWYRCTRLSFDEVRVAEVMIS